MRKPCAEFDQALCFKKMLLQCRLTFVDQTPTEPTPLTCRSSRLVKISVMTRICYHIPKRNQRQSISEEVSHTSSHTHGAKTGLTLERNASSQRKAFAWGYTPIQICKRHTCEMESPINAYVIIYVDVLALLGIADDPTIIYNPLRPKLLPGNTRPNERRSRGVDFP
jgi:hypothetical protein